ncbi:hypothetical protein KV134_08945 [Tetragenococcus halophilus]|nr:hypothetical protein KV134_08945 [Tetragenococcus halophilus]
MESVYITLPNTWKGLPVHLSSITTTEDNRSLNNEDTVLVASLINQNVIDFISDYDVLLLKSKDEEFESHAFKYNKIVNEDSVTHKFTPLSKFLGKKTFEATSINDVSIIGKVLCSFKGVSEEIMFKQFNEDE